MLVLYTILYYKLYYSKNQVFCENCLPLPRLSHNKQRPHGNTPNITRIKCNESLLSNNMYEDGKMGRSSLFKGSLCAASTGSMTMAIKARRALSQSGITVNVKKLSGGSDSRGCIYGIEYPCELSGNILSLLQSRGISAELFQR